MSKKNVHLGCLKITEKVSFNIASKASYVYILNGQKFIKNAKKKLGEVLKDWIQNDTKPKYWKCK